MKPFFKLLDIHNTYHHSTPMFLKLLTFIKYSVEILQVFTVFQENGFIIFCIYTGFFAILFSSVALQGT